MPTHDVHVIIDELKSAFILEPEDLSPVETLDLLSEILRGHEAEVSSGTLRSA